MNRTSALLVPAFAGLSIATTFALQDSDKPAAAWTQDELEALSKRIESEVEELRGAKFLRPVSVSVATRSDLLEYARQRIAMTETPEKIAADEAIAKLLGVIPPELDLMATYLDFLEDQVAGFYDPVSDSFRLMDTAPRGMAGAILSHELCHALDDQIYGLDGPMLALADVTDASRAYQAVVEGSGTILGSQWALQHADEVDLSDSGEMMELSAESMSRAPAWIWKPAAAVYVSGGAFLARTDTWLRAQTAPLVPADVEHAYREPPRSTEQILHPEKYWDPARADEPREVVLAAPDLPRGWSVQREDTLGELMLAILCAPPEERGGSDPNPMAILGVRFTNDLARGWGGDRVMLLANESARYLVLVTQWDSERDAAEFYGALLLLEPSFEAAARALGSSSEAESGADVAYGASTDEVVLRVHSGVERRDLRKLERLFERTAR